MLAMPPMPSARNHARVIGPNSRPTVPVPLRWIRNSPISTPRVIGSTQDESDGAITFSPSTADSTDMAGVMAPSP